MTIKGSCHCGQIEIQVTDLPDYLGRCNCSICSRYGALWAYYPPEGVTIKTRERQASGYIWGDREMEFQHCPKCGCITHYTTTDLCDEKLVAVNFRMVDSSIYDEVSIKDIDGASY